MSCHSCKSHFCLWCRSIIKSVQEHQNDSDAVHRHVFECPKRPKKAHIPTDSVLFPVGHQVDEENCDFIHAFSQIRKLETLAVQMMNGYCTTRTPSFINS
jgi:hypothetical protein